ncbi:hypothetical protein [Aquiflexum sp.]|uniref:hypothetical protein n=1 Tax=Aquiflexum sp. TaxID=1872584 RepID=UPI003592E9CF
MKGLKLIVNIHLIGLLILMSCGNKRGHDTEQDRSNDRFEEPGDTTDRKTNQRNKKTSSELVPKDRAKSPLNPNARQTLKSEWLGEVRFLASN